MKFPHKVAKRSLLVLVLSGGFFLGYSNLAAASPANAGETKAAFDPVTESAMIAKSTAKQAPLRILVIGGHPADVFDQSGGTMAHHVERGDWVGCVVVTTGTRVHDKVVANQLAQSKTLPSEEEINKILDERAKVKEAEVVKACAILGVPEKNIYFLNVTDQVLMVKEPIVLRIAQLIRKLKPDVVLTHYPYEDGGLGPHAVAGQLAVQAVSAAGGVDPDDKNRPHKVTQVFFFGTGAAGVRTNIWSSQGGFYNDVYIDITDVAAKKVAALDCMVSQNYTGAYAHKRIDSTDGGFGAKMALPYAEAFISMRSTSHYYLPVSAIDRAHASGSDHDAIMRKGYRVTIPPASE